MTAPAAAPASGPVAPPVQRASAQAPADAHAFAAVLDALPAAASKAGASTGEDQPHVAKESRDDGSSSATVRPSFAVERRRASGLPAIRPQRRLRNGCGFASRGPGVLARPGCGQSVRSRGRRRVRRRQRPIDRCRTARWRTRLSLRRLRVHERDCKPRADRRGVVRAGRRLRPGPCDPGESERRKRRRRSHPRRERGGLQRRATSATAQRTRVSGASGEPHARTAAHEAVRGEREPAASAAAAARVASSAAPPASADSRGDGADGRLPDPTGSAAPSLAQADSFGALFSAPFAAHRRSGPMVRRRQPRGRRSRRAPARLPPAPRPPGSPSRKSTSIFRRAASRTSR